MKSHVKESAASRRKREQVVNRLRGDIESYLAKFPQRDKPARRLWLRRLLKDENFRDRIKQIREQLEEAYKSAPKALYTFFRYYSIVTPLNAPLALAEANKPSNLRDTQRALGNYLEFALRFGVYARLRLGGEPVENKKSPRAFSFYLLARPVGRRMKARIGEQIRPDIEETPLNLYSEETPSGEAVTDSPYDCPELHLPKKVAKELEKSGARILQLRDDSTATVLHELQYWFYDPNSVTFVVHGERPPVILCLVGENVRKREDWRNCERLVTAMQQEYFHRTQAGRKKKRAARAAAEQQSNMPGTQKEKAESLDLGITDSSKHQALSRASKRQRERKNP